MKPIKLTMQAFGPYAGKEVIDFSQLGNRTMFVISGKTGAGKTTIFDGISFAIYGRASGEGRMGPDLRSQFAEDDLLTEVSLEFSLRNQVYYICRSPQQEKKKARGDGYTTVNAKAEMYMLDEDGTQKLIAANVRETDEKIKEIIQLDANQFRQILMIPQGDFRKLLTSDSRDKEVILQRLFHTELYKQIEDKLREKASLLKKEVELGMTERTRLLKGISTNKNTHLELELEEEILNVTAVLSLLEEVQKTLQSDVNEFTKKMNEQKIVRDEAKRKADAAEDVMKQMAIREQLSHKHNELKAREKEIEEMKSSVELAHKAANLQHQEQLCQRLKKELDSYKARLETDMNHYNEEKKKLDMSEARLRKEEEKQEQRDQLDNDLSRLINMREDVYSFSQKQAELEQIQVKKEDYQKSILHVKENLSQLKDRSEKQRKLLKDFEQAQMLAFQNENKLSQVESVKKQLLTVSTALKKKTDLHSEFKLKTKLFEKAKEISEDAHRTLEKIEDSWLKGQAGHLAQHLEDGKACPVCGSNHHPDLARVTESDQSADDVKIAKLAVSKSDQELLEAERSWMKVKTESEFHQENTQKLVDDLTQLVPGFTIENMDMFIQDYEKKHKETAQFLLEANAKVQKIPELNAQISTCEVELEKQNNKLNDMLDVEKQLSIQYTGAATIIHTLSSKIPENMRGKEQFDKEVVKLEKEKRVLQEALDTARRDHVMISENLARLSGTITNLEIHMKEKEKAMDIERNNFLNQLEKEAFETYKVYHAAKLEPIEIKKIENAIRAYYEEYRSISDRLKDYEERLQGMEKPDLNLLKKSLEKAEQYLTLLGDQHAHLIMQVKRNEEIAHMVKNINEEMKALEEEYDLVGHLSDITRGQNTYRLTFERFVLASFLDGILEAANSRLTKMTSGRYQLLRKTDRSKGNVQSGLELLIFDQYTGQDRHVKTLSGGESFKAALSLALGLADIVQQHAGGVSLETMFIDEGFGTLDPESLDHAIEALMDIQSSGRLVGIISHVPELKERIDARLEVTANQYGSKTAFHFTG
ncbi:AAA family ATPase [Lederbergia lenta]|uniref:Nuclease SbcCD subunit C n=1 Tax=Lederbergia lenta TaxID=1467 RepID=A0A2X4WPJ2_LEDLE|nr:SMC family ATPase [Lederbergia lenta]MEC2324528.1 SMC family ATPase [Lederbergia lenta]SQI59580.1 putative exonuclease [Lederbergia lenta]